MLMNANLIKKRIGLDSSLPEHNSITLKYFLRPCDLV